MHYCNKLQLGYYTKAEFFLLIHTDKSKLKQQRWKETSLSKVKWTFNFLTYDITHFKKTWVRTIRAHSMNFVGGLLVIG